jgi:hypothetical protein
MSISDHIQTMPSPTQATLTHVLHSFSRARQPASRVLTCSPRWVTHSPRCNPCDIANGNQARGIHSSSPSQSHENPLVCVDLCLLCTVPSVDILAITLIPPFKTSVHHMKPWNPPSTGHPTPQSQPSTNNATSRNSSQTLTYSRSQTRRCCSQWERRSRQIYRRR